MSLEHEHHAAKRKRAGDGSAAAAAAAAVDLVQVSPVSPLVANLDGRLHNLPLEPLRFIAQQVSRRPLDHAETEAILAEFLRLLHLKLFVNDTMGDRISPSPLADEMWHKVILDTRLFSDLCRIIGKVLHHVPGGALEKHHVARAQRLFAMRQLYWAAFREGPLKQDGKTRSPTHQRLFVRRADNGTLLCLDHVHPDDQMELVHSRVLSLLGPDAPAHPRYFYGFEELGMWATVPTGDATVQMLVTVEGDRAEQAAEPTLQSHDIDWTGLDERLRQLDLSKLIFCATRFLFLGLPLAVMVRELLRLIHLKVAHKDEFDSIISPTRLMNSMWSALILDTQAYERMQVQLGMTLHHAPVPNMDGESRITRDTRLAVMRREYAATFGEPPIAYNISLDHGDQIFCRDLCGITRTLDVDLTTATVEQVQRQMWDVSGVEPCHIRLIFAGRHLETDRTLAYYNIGKESTLYMHLRMRGC